MRNYNILKVFAGAVACWGFFIGGLGAQTASQNAPSAATAPSSVSPNDGQPGPSSGGSGVTQIEDLPIQGLNPPFKSATTDHMSTPMASTDAKPNPNLPHDLSPLGMFQRADLVVKSVMIGLIWASIVTWTVWLFKSIQLLTARARLKRELRAISQSTSLAAASQTLKQDGGILRALIDVADLELRLSTDTVDKSGIKDRVASRLERVESAAIRGMNKGTGVLATIGSTAPFIGLFGTVWGIMNSFIGISKSQTTNLAVVAPGIAEALLATAAGLVAAIPAVILYNWFSRGIGVYRAFVGDAAAEVMRLVSRDLDLPVSRRRSQAAE